MLCLGFAVVTLAGNGRLLADLPEGLLAYYPLNGDGTDASGNGHDGTVVGATPTSNRFDQSGKALLFDGINSFIRVPDSTDLRLASTDFTISAWIFETERDAHFSDCIISKRGPTGPGAGRPGDGRGWIISVRGLHDTNSTGRLFYQVSGGEDPRAFSAGVLSLNQWHHVAVVYHRASSSVDMFIDGAWDSTAKGIPPPNPSVRFPMHIGNDSQLAYNNAYVFHGKISDVRIYNHALTTPEAAGLYGVGLFLNRIQFTGRAMTRMFGGLTVGQRVIVESSPDMVHWAPIETNIATSMTLSVTNFINPAKSAEFFRVSVP
jgi:hypothetical protein